MRSDELSVQHATVTRVTSGAAPIARLFCFPPAGGAASAYRHWRRDLPASLELCLIEFPGHGSRLLEPPITAFEAFLDAAAQAVLVDNDLPYMLFGHSLGGILAFELAHRLAFERRRGPAHVFVACSPAPHTRTSIAGLHELESEALRHEMRRLGGTPAEILDNDELWTLLEPATRADLSFASHYTARFDRPRLACPLTVFAGSADPFVDLEDAAGWRSYATHSDVVILGGAHFTIHDQREQFFETFRPQLERSLDSLAPPVGI